MDATRYKSLADRGLIVTDSLGNDAVRVYLQYVRDVPGESREARGEALQERFEELRRDLAETGFELRPESLSVSGQMIEALLPVERYEQAERKLKAKDMRVDVAESFDATL